MVVGEECFTINIRKANRIINDRCELTVHQINNRFYLKKNFREKFKYEVEIVLSEDNPGELVVREKCTGTIRAAYYSKATLKKLQEIIECEATMRFVFFKDDKQGVWNGILLPELKRSRLWNQLKCKDEPGLDDKVINSEHMKFFWKEKYRGLVEADDIYVYIRIGYIIADSVYAYRKEQLEECIILCIWSLVNEFAKMQRRCRKSEAGISGDQKVTGQSLYCYRNMWGSCDAKLNDIEIEELVLCQDLVQNKMRGSAS